ncbi:MAG: hypothetical protein O7D86_01315 [Proteobacteria bacterium]|nr:hypothetical protein [Pseudomonadota bacterium]
MANSELFSEEEARDPKYNAVRDNDPPEDIRAKEFCIELWERFESYADSHFLEQFKIDFDARFWEMYLICTLLERGFPVECPKPGPDILLPNDDSKIWIEAIAPNSGSDESPDSVPEHRIGIAQSVPNDQVILRYRSAIAEKCGKYQNYLDKGILESHDAFIIAINGCNVRSSRTDFDPPQIVRSVFPIGDEYITIDRESGDINDTGFHFRNAVTKASGAEVSIDIFIDEHYTYLSGVLFSNSDCYNRPVINGEDFIFVHNPIAKISVPHELFNIGREYIADPSGNEYILRFNDWRNA